MRFSRYSRGGVVAFAFDSQGSVDLRRADGVGLFRTRDGIPRAVVDAPDLADTVAILLCIAEDLDSEGCISRGVEVAP